ncbi:hypothetical protein Tco_0524810 [Tanacetum coccineum]
MKQNEVSDDALRLSLFPYTLTHHATAWYDRLPRNSIHSFDDMMRKFLSKYFPPSMCKVHRSLGSLPSNTVANPRGDLKFVTTRSGISYDGPTIPPISIPLPKEAKREPKATKDKRLRSSELTLLRYALELANRFGDLSGWIGRCLFSFSGLLFLSTAQSANWDTEERTYSQRREMNNWIFLDKECDLPFSVTFSNPLFDSNDDFTSSDDKPLHKEDVQEDNFKIYSNPLFEFDDEYISSDVNPIFNEVLEEIENKDTYVSNFDEQALLVTSLSDANKDECFDPGGDIDEINAFLDMDVSTDIKDDYYDSEGDIMYLESLIIKGTIPNLHPELFLDHDPRSLKDEHDNDDVKSMVKVFGPGIHEKIISPTYVRITFEDRHYLSLAIFLPFLTYPMNSLLLFSSGSEDIIFDPDISTISFYSLELVVSHRSGTFICFNVYLNILNESPMEICSSTCFIPNITMIWGESS